MGLRGVDGLTVAGGSIAYDLPFSRVGRAAFREQRPRLPAVFAGCLAREFQLQLQGVGLGCGRFCRACSRDQLVKRIDAMAMDPARLKGLAMLPGILTAQGRDQVPWRQWVPVPQQARRGSGRRGKKGGHRRQLS